MSHSSTCQLCLNRPQKYCCPRCNILYCSVDCYKSQKHNQCSEAFYKDCVVEEMAMQSANRNQQQRCGTLDDIPGLSDDIKRMYAILKRMESHESIQSDFDIDEDEFDTDDEQFADLDLSTRLSGVDLNNADAIWSKLTSNEKQEFEQIAKNDDITKLLPSYEPWWTQKKLIEDISEETSVTITATQTTPEIMKNIVDFSKLSSKPPADCVKHNLKNVLASYALTVRFFNGDLSSTHEFNNYFITVCSNLKFNSNFDDDSIAIESVVHNCRNEGLTINDGQVALLHNDVKLICQSVSYVLAALSDIHRLLSLAKTNKYVKRSTNNVSDFSKRFFDHEIVNFENLGKTKLSASIKKIEYYLAFVAKYKENVFA